jgi:hypothetical protein
VGLRPIKHPRTAECATTDTLSMRKHSGVIGPPLSPVRRAFDVSKTGEVKASIVVTG